MCAETGTIDVSAPKAVELARRDGLKFIDMLDDRGSEERGAFIRKWLAKHPEVERYVVVDDHASGHAGHPLFKCKTDIGLTPELVDEIVDYFEGASKGEAAQRRKYPELEQNDERRGRTVN